MPTGDKFVNIVQKRLMGFGSFKNYFLDYLKDSAVATLAKVYNKDGTFGDAKLQIKAGGSNDQIKLEMISEWPTFLFGTDGSGHIFKVVGASPPSYFADVPFENQTGNDYDVGIHYAERPSGVQINPRTGKPEYQRWQEEMGVADDPVNVADQGGGVIRLRLPTSMCPGDRTCVGRKCLVWMKVPADDALTEIIAIEELTVAFSTYNYIDTSSSSLGQTTISATAADYTVLLLGPTIARTGDLDIEAADGYWYVGEVTGNGPAATPTVFDMSDQRLITKSLSDLLENLVYDNVVNTFTRKQIFAPAAEHAEEAINATGSGANPGVKGTGGAGGADGVQGTATGNGRGVRGDGAGTGPGVEGSSLNGYGTIANSSATSPARASAMVTPQDTEPTTKDDGADYTDSTSKKAARCLNGKFRTYAEQESTRVFLYPIACGQPHVVVAPGDPHWFWEAVNHRWKSDNTGNAEHIGFDLNRFVPQGATITLIRAYVNPGNARSGLNRMQIAIFSEDNEGAGQTNHAYAHDDTTANPQWLKLYPWDGSHTGADDQAILTDSTKSWDVDELVGETVYNITDGSSGTITANTATTVTATLSGGTDDDWDTDDDYWISGDLDVAIASATRQYWVRIDSGNDAQLDDLESLEITYLENEYLRVP